MAHFAQIDSNNIVLQVLTIDNSHRTNGQDFLANTLKLGGTWIETSYNTYGGVHYVPGSNLTTPDSGIPLYKNYAGIGYTFSPTLSAFIPPQPYPSWVLNETTCLWSAPIAYPQDGNGYAWNETGQSWTMVTRAPTS